MDYYLIHCNERKCEYKIKEVIFLVYCIFCPVSSKLFSSSHFNPPLLKYPSYDLNEFNSVVLAYRQKQMGFLFNVYFTLINFNKHIYFSEPKATQPFCAAKSRNNMLQYTDDSISEHIFPICKTDSRDLQEIITLDSNHLFLIRHYDHPD